MKSSSATMLRVAMKEKRISYYVTTLCVHVFVAADASDWLTDCVCVCIACARRFEWKLENWNVPPEHIRDGFLNGFCVLMTNEPFDLTLSLSSCLLFPCFHPSVNLISNISVFLFHFSYNEFSNCLSFGWSGCFMYESCVLCFRNFPKWHISGRRRMKNLQTHMDFWHNSIDFHHLKRVSIDFCFVSTEFPIRAEHLFADFVCVCECECECVCLVHSWILLRHKRSFSY